MKLRIAAAALATAFAAAMVAGCDRPGEPSRSPGPGAGVPQPKTGAKSDPASVGSSGQTPSGGATGQANEGSTADKQPKRPATKY